MEKVFLKRTKEEWRKILVDLLVFYSTAFCVVLAIVSLAALMFLVPFFIDPAWSTLQAEFNENGTECRTVTAFKRKGILFRLGKTGPNFLIYKSVFDARLNPLQLFFQNLGRSNCTWSSCQEGCTKTVYSCMQIEVEYQVEAIPQLQRGRLFTNVKVKANEKESCSFQT